VGKKDMIGKNLFAELAKAVSRPSTRETSVSYYLTDLLADAVMALELITRLIQVMEQEKDLGDVHSPEGANGDDVDDEDETEVHNQEGEDLTEDELKDHLVPEEEDPEDDSTPTAEIAIGGDATEAPIDDEALYDLPKSLDELLPLVRRLVDELRIIIHHCKHHFQDVVHVNKPCDGEAGHCARFALGQDCSLGKGHVHKVDCVRCRSILGCPSRFQCLVQASLNVILARHGDGGAYSPSGKLGKEFATMKIAASHVSKGIRAYAGHRVRASYQDEQCKLVQAGLELCEILLLIDYKMKVLQAYHCEDQKKFFGKQGNSILGAWLVWREQDGLRSAFVDLVLDDNAQDAPCVQSCLFYLMSLIEKRFPTRSRVILQSDNAANFNTRLHLEFIWQMNAVDWKQSRSLKVSRWIFPEPQCGKSNLDAHFSYVMLTLNGYVDSGHDLTTPDHIFQALSTRPIANSSVVLLHVAKALPKAGTSLKPFPVQGSRSTSDIVFDDDGLVKAYEQTAMKCTTIDMEQSSIQKWRADYKSKGCDFSAVCKTEVLRDYHSSTWTTKNATEEDAGLPVIELEIKPEATSTERVIGEHLKTFLTTTKESFTARVDGTSSAISVVMKFGSEDRRGWAKVHSTKRKTLPFPDFVMKKLDELVSANDHPSVALVGTNQDTVRRRSRRPQGSARASPTGDSVSA
jgi:hypothetical protein